MQNAEKALEYVQDGTVIVGHRPRGHSFHPRPADRVRQGLQSRCADVSSFGRATRELGIPLTTLEEGCLTWPWPAR